MKLAVQIAAGIVMASAVVGVARHLYVQAQMRAAVAAIEQMQADMQRRTDDRAAKAQRAKRQQLQAAADQARAEAARARSVQENEIRKAAAWQAYYTPSLACHNPRDWNVQVECGNAHMRARREFETAWDRGEL
jgi:hypothetical protein